MTFANTHLTREVAAIWDQNADFWDQRMGEGNEFHKLLIEPAELRLLNLRSGDAVLDAACGNGQFARRMAELGAAVTAVDASAGMIQNAIRRSTQFGERIQYRVLDCTRRDELLALGERSFDHVVCTMALMDMSEIEPLISASAVLLKKSGQFVFSVLHPCFNYELARQGVEQYDAGGELVREYFVRVSRYSEPSTSKGLAMDGQPVPQYYFHRPVSLLIEPFLAADFVLDGIEEPAFGDQADPQKLFCMVFQKIPPALVVRMRLLH
jgi:2-polyprenyl-3-methyl-5-hydroxy-6-metoxy-1,4-benzoquinol methylase